MNGTFLKRAIIPPSDFILINQSDLEKPTDVNKKNIFHFKERGLSKSRNHAIGQSSGDICLISDDDLGYIDTIKKTITESFEKHTDADIITFQVETPDGKPYKKYKKEKFWHTKKSIMSVSSVEIAFRLKSIRQKKLKFDEKFGLGSDFPTGEEIIFLTDALKKGLKILYVPIPIVIHPLESSGKNYDNIPLIRAKGAMFYRIFGFLGYIASALFAYKKYKFSPFSFKEFSFMILEGITQYRRTL